MVAIAAYAVIGVAGLVGTAVTLRRSGDAFHLTAAQRSELRRDIGSRNAMELAPTGFIGKVGATVPSSVALRPLPARDSARIHATKAYSYAVLYYYGMLGSELIIVDTRTRKIAAIVLG
jgi:hypothetical protein